MWNSIYVVIVSSLQPQQQIQKMGLVDFCSEYMGVKNVRNILIPQVSNVHINFLEFVSSYGLYLSSSTSKIKPLVKLWS